MAASDDGETVDAFLERIASLKIKRDREDEERTRKLEQEILQGRRERQARRAERARSLSPPKESTTTISPSFANSPTNSAVSQSILPPVDLHPSPRPKLSFAEASMEPGSPSARDRVTSDLARPLPASRNTSPTRPIPNNATVLSRSGTLSWQQRPSSRDSNSSRTRPFSGVSAELAPSRASEQPQPGHAEELSRAEIAQSLGSKEPTWFRQTADRGVGSAAFRRNQEDPMREKTFMEDRMRLPGMSRESTAEPEKSPLPGSAVHRAASSLEDSAGHGAGRLDDLSKPSNSPSGASRSPLPFSSSQRPMQAELDAQDALSTRPTDNLQSQSKPVSDRPPSPTKGLGGFVQSAMMKRSDSVNKRWSTQAAPGLKRGDSIAGHRGTLGNLAPVPLTRGGSPPRETKPSLGPSSSPSTYSRPTSSHSTSTRSQKHLAELQHDISGPVIDPASLKQSLHTPEAAEKPRRGIEPPLEVGGGAFRSNSSYEELPSSPTKTMDPKRWSPTKASWLESALSKPESPKITSPKVEQPTWRSELLKSKQSNTEPSEIRNSKPSFEVVTQPGLMRSPPPGGHSKLPSIGGLPEGFSSGLVKKPPDVQQKASSVKDFIRESAPRDDTPSIEPSIALTTSESSTEPTSQNQKTTGSDLKAGKTDANTDIDQSLNPTSKHKPPVMKPKPQTPPTTDFRANLKTRQKDSQDSASNEPEFKNVFGKLRRAETKNYVAPDLLKANILTGKAALNLTGGPQKAKRTDEFKESLLSQKEAMKAGGGSINKKIETGHDSSIAGQKPIATIPEALARRNQLSKLAGITVGSVDMKPAVQASINSKTPVKVPPELSRKAPTSTVAANIEPSKEMSAPQVLSVAATRTSSEPKQPISDTRVAKAEPSEKAGSGRLANRMNPALASILMRGPPSTTSSRDDSTEDRLASSASSARPTAVDSPDPGDGQLTHMTKGRAKGPKRRLPKTEVDNKEADEAKPFVMTKSLEIRKASSPRPQSTGLDGAASTIPTPLNSSPSPLSNRPLATLVNQNGKIKPPVSKPLPKSEMKMLDDSETSNKPKPIIAAKSPDLRRVSSPKPQPAVLETAVSVTPSNKRRPTSPLATRTSSPGKRAMEPEAVQNAAPIAKDTQGDQIQNEARPNFVSKSYVPPNTTVEVTGRSNGLGLEFGNRGRAPGKTPKPELTPPEDEAFSKGIAMRESPTLKPGVSARAVERASTVAASPAASQVFEDFFDEHPRVGDKADIDAQVVVSSNASAIEKTKTLRMQIWEVNGDGKRQDMPPQQEHIIFEDSMYLCVHSLENAKGLKITEAFLWCGDNVGEAAVEDAQLFCRKIARENGAKLEMLKQGKEPASFIQALGGIIITRRSKSSALYMLCGRRHLGHVSFDEVDIDASNLCSGFPYLISARFGNLYLWKGKGSGADELGCARLIGMDLGLTGEIEEVNEGEEPPSFWEAAFGTNPHLSRSKWSDHWTLRGMPTQHVHRLFRIELETPKLTASFWSRRGSSPAKTTKTGLAKEITPFCQRDLEASHVFVLDAYFEIYVFVGGHASSKPAEYVTALFFAQEYGILAASMQDRPFVPPCHVALAEVPPDFWMVFRKWTQTSRKVSGGGPGMIPLNAAIEALA